jgi:hypothetical protein
MLKVSLFKMKNERISISIDLYFDANGRLILEGYDIGPQVDEFFGDSDYEYSYSIDPEEVKKLYDLLNVAREERQELLLAIKKRFGGNHAYSAFGEFMSENDIEYDAFTWS